MKNLLLSAAIVLGLAAPAFAQQPPPAAPTSIGAYQGNELMRLTTNAGSAGQVTMNHVRNTTGYLAVPTGGTVTTTASYYNAAVVATGAITTWAVNMPNPAPDGMVFTVINGTGSAFTTNTTVAVQAQAGAATQSQTLTTAYASQTLAAGSSAAWLFTLNSPSSTTGVWYRIR